MDILYYYIIVSAVYLIITAFLKGFIKLESYSYSDFIDALFWPVSLASIIGTLLRILLIKLEIIKE